MFEPSKPHQRHCTPACRIAAFKAKTDRLVLPGQLEGRAVSGARSSSGELLFTTEYVPPGTKAALTTARDKLHNSSRAADARSGFTC